MPGCRVLNAEQFLADRPTVELDDAGVPSNPLVGVDLTALGSEPDAAFLARLQSALQASDLVVVGWCEAAQVAGLHEVAIGTTVTVVAGADAGALPEPYVAVGDVDAALAQLSTSVDGSPRAALVLAHLLRQSEQLSVPEALHAESMAYSMLLAGPEFAAWLAGRLRRPDPGPTQPAVLVDRDGDRLRISFNRPDRHNAFGRWVRDAACEALDLALLDATIRYVVLTGEGPSFCSGGDLDEFGTQTDPVAGHLIRMQRNVGGRVHQLAGRTTARVHGACIGAGVELPAFAGRVLAARDSWFQLPELAMGLLPGAGGTVSLPRRIGRWRTAWLALTAARLTAREALAWGLVDELG